LLGNGLSPLEGIKCVASTSVKSVTSTYKIDISNTNALLLFKQKVEKTIFQKPGRRRAKGWSCTPLLFHIEKAEYKGGCKFFTGYSHTQQFYSLRLQVTYGLFFIVQQFGYFIIF